MGPLVDIFQTASGGGNKDLVKRNVRLRSQGTVGGERQMGGISIVGERIPGVFLTCCFARRKEKWGGGGGMS